MNENEVECKVMEVKRIKNKLKELREESNLKSSSSSERTKRIKIKLHEKMLERSEKELNDILRENFNKQVLLPPLEWS